MKLALPYHQLELIAYEGAGNKTPVLDLSLVPAITRFTPQQIRHFLETERQFRLFLQEKGKALSADTVMIYYRTPGKEYDAVTFIGEPNASLTQPFSDMCGNGIRCLCFHLYLTELTAFERNRYFTEGIRIWAGSIRTLRISHVNESAQSCLVSVEMGAFRYQWQKVHAYVKSNKVSADYRSFTLPSLLLPKSLRELSWGMGFNGDQEGEPHLVLLMTLSEFRDVVVELFAHQLSTDEDMLMSYLRRLASLLGSTLTFNTDLFPQGINANFAVLEDDKLYIATHERNLSSSLIACQKQQYDQGICHCVTLACGTGGAAVANIASLRGCLKNNTILTIHSGGEILYTITPEQTLMVGPAQKLSPSSAFHQEGKEL